VSFLAPKLVLTPLLIASASLAGRRWGAAMSGWIVALPLTSGPILVFLALELGTEAAVAAASGSLLGALAQIAFVVGYGTAASRQGWPASLAAGAIAFALVVATVSSASPMTVYVASIAAMVPVVLWLSTRPTADGIQNPPPSRWDIPARAIVATALVVSITAVAPIIGGRAAGILATFPVYASVLTTFAHRASGAPEAREVLLGLALGLPGFATFFLIIAGNIRSLGIGPSVLLGLAAAIASNLVILGGHRRLFGDRSRSPTGS
jgi:hypothetical protein